MRIGESGGEKRLAHNREPWVRANGPAPTARQIAIAFQKYDATPWMRSSAFPPLQKNHLLNPPYMHDPSIYSSSSLLNTLSGSACQRPNLLFLLQRLRTKPLSSSSYLPNFFDRLLPGAYLNCRPEATPE